MEWNLIYERTVTIMEKMESVHCTLFIHDSRKLAACVFYCCHKDGKNLFDIFILWQRVFQEMRDRRDIWTTEILTSTATETAGMEIEEVITTTATETAVRGIRIPNGRIRCFFWLRLL